MDGVIAVEVFIPVRRAIFGEHALGRGRGRTLDQVVLIGQTHRRGDQQLTFRINRHRTPVKYADIARENQRALLGRRRPRIAVIAQLAEPHAAAHLVERRNAPHRFFRQRLRNKVQAGDRLRSGEFLALDAAFGRDLHLINRIDRLAGQAVEHEQVAGFGRQDHRRLLAALIVDIHQRRLRRVVAVPEIVIGALITPFKGAGFQIQRHQRIAEFLRVAVGIALDAHFIRRGVAERHIDQAVFQVGAQRRPGHRGVLRIGRIRRNRLGRLRLSRIEVPHQTAGNGVVGADDAGRVAAVKAVVHHRAADNHQIARYQRRRGLHQRMRTHFAHIGMQIDHAVLTEISARLAAVGIQRHQLRIGGRVVDTLAAERWLRCAAVSRRIAGVVEADAATGLMLLHIGAILRRRIFPFHRAGFRIERMHLVMRRTEVEHAVRLERRRLKGVFGRVVALTQIAGVVGPGDLKIFHVIFGDLIQRREAQRIGGAAVGRPVVARAGRGGRRARIGNGSLLRQRIVKAEADHQGDHHHHRGAEERMERALGQRTHHPGQRQPDAEQTEQVAARDPLPFVKARFPDNPEQRDPHQQRVKRQGTAFIQKQQYRGEQ